MTAWVLIWALGSREGITIPGLASKDACENLYKQMVLIKPFLDYPAYPGHLCIEYAIAK